MNTEEQGPYPSRSDREASRNIGKVYSVSSEVCSDQQQNLLTNHYRKNRVIVHIPHEDPVFPTGYE